MKIHQHVGLVEFYPVIYSLWRSDTAARTYIVCSMFSILFHEIAPARCYCLH